MKAIMMSIRPQWIAKILNKEKTIEIRKRFPKDYVGWVYIYCTKEQGLARLNNNSWNDTFIAEKEITNDNFKHIYSGYDGKGKVVARFWCDNVEEIKVETAPFDSNLIHWETKTLSMFDICQKSCLSEKELYNYLQGKNGYAIHITKLEIFDKPKEISEFLIPKETKYTIEWKELTKAPQSYCFIEI